MVAASNAVRALLELVLKLHPEFARGEFNSPEKLQKAWNDHAGQFPGTNVEWYAKQAVDALLNALTSDTGWGGEDRPQFRGERYGRVYLGSRYEIDLRIQLDGQYRYVVQAAN
jgi:hypothetical protein